MKWRFPQLQVQHRQSYLLCLSILLFGTVYRDPEKRDGLLFVYGVDSLFTIAIVLNDFADILLLSRALETEAFETKEKFLYAFLVVNVLIAEGAALISYITDAQTSSRRLGDKDWEKLQLRVGVLRAARKKARAQTSFTGLLLIPLVLAFGVLRDALSGEERAAIAVLGLMAIPALISLTTDKFYLYVIPGTPFQLQEFVPRLVALVVIGIYAGVDMLFPTLDASTQQLTFALYFVYVALPLCIRACVDLYRYCSLWSKLTTTEGKASFTQRSLTNFDFLCIGLLLPKCNELRELE